MLKSLYSGVSGMKGFQTKLDVIGNNIANVNTVGFKKGRVMFQDIINQNISGATSPNVQTGGVNPKQVGLGTRISTIDTIHTPGSPMTTNVGTDLAIDGDAFFVVAQSGANATPYFTKAGNFTLDASGNLVNSNGYFVKGIEQGATGTPVPLVDINIPSSQYTSFSIDANGYINVVKKDGSSGKLTTQNGTPILLATAVVANPGGLSKVGNTMFEQTGNSGAPTINSIQANNGQINSGILEMSNVDLTEEFTELIVAQRGFQANARTITTSDSILEEIINLKR